MAREPKETREDVDGENGKAICGIVRPIAGFAEYSAKHWTDVAAIVDEAVEQSGMQARLVSEDVASSIIHARILKNLYSNSIVIADISGKNPNVMLELGIRLAFDKPVIVIKDDVTDYSFDTSPIEHVGYPKSLHYSSILEFKDNICKKIIAINKNGGQDSSFLKQFGPIKIAQIDEEKVPAFEVLSDDIRELKRLVRGMSSERNALAHMYPKNALLDYASLGRLEYGSDELADEDIEEIMNKAPMLSGIDKVRVLKTIGGYVFDVKGDSLGNWAKADATQAMKNFIDSVIERRKSERN